MADNRVEDASGEQGAGNSVACGINDQGEVAGAFNTNVALRPFRAVRKGGSQELLLPPGSNGGIVSLPTPPGFTRSEAVSAAENATVAGMTTSVSQFPNRSCAGHRDIVVVGYARQSHAHGDGEVDKHVDRQVARRIFVLRLLQ